MSIPPLREGEQFDAAQVTPPSVLAERYGSTMANALANSPYLVAGLDRLRADNFFQG